MKILLLHNYYRHRGGEETYFESLQRLLEENGHTVRLFTKNSSEITSILAKFHTVSSLFIPTSVKRELVDMIQSFKPDIAHFNNIYPLITSHAYSVFKQHNIPIVQTIHNYRLFCPKGTLYREGRVCEDCVLHTLPFPAMIHACYQESHPATIAVGTKLFQDRLTGQYDKVDHFIFPSEFTKKYYVKRLASLAKKSTCIPYYVTGKKVNRKGNFFLYAGRLSEEKGIIELLEILKKLPKITLKIVGKGPLEKQVKRYEQYSNITLHNNLSHQETLKYIQRAKCVIIPSKWFEVLPYVYLESLASGTPTLTPNTDVFRRSVAVDNRYYYAFNNFDDLRKKIMDIEQHAAFATDSFYNEYVEHFSKDQHYSKLIALYNRLSCATSINT